MIIFYAIGAFGLSILLHGVFMRMPVQVDTVKKFLIVGIPLGVLLTSMLLAYLGLTLKTLAAVLMYALLCELYMFCFTLVLLSISANLLIKLLDGPIDLASLTSVDDPKEMVLLRLDRLQKNGFIVRVDGNLALSEKGFKYHESFKSLHSFFGHRKEPQNHS